RRIQFCGTADYKSSLRERREICAKMTDFRIYVSGGLGLVPPPIQSADQSVHSSTLCLELPRARRLSLNIFLFRARFRKKKMLRESRLARGSSKQSVEECTDWSTLSQHLLLPKTRAE